MHEASLVGGIIKIVLDEAKKHNVSAVSCVKLEVGLLAVVEAETLKACFEMMREGTVAQNATLEINIAPLACTCMACDHQFTLLKRHFFCPKCNDAMITFADGHGCSITGMEAEVPEKDEK